MHLDRAAEAIRKCEAELRRIVSEAADAGDYDRVITLTNWAKHLASMVSTNGRAVARPATPTRPTGKASEYPRFVRGEDQIIKIGWSKSEKREYQHRAPKVVIEQMINNLQTVGADGRVFPITECLPLLDPDDASEMPAYQAYIVLAWLRNVGIVDQHGRQGYSIPNHSRLTELVDSAWRGLPKG